MIKIRYIGGGSRRVRLLLGRGRGRLDVVGQPSETLEQTLACGGATGHDVPDLVLKLGELERLGDFLRLHGCDAR